MKYILVCAVIAVFAVLGALFVRYHETPLAPGTPSNEDASPEVQPETYQTYRNDAYGVSFRYPSTYYRKERQVGTAANPQIAVVLVPDTAENRALIDGTYDGPAREGPTTITVDLYQNPKRLSPTEWIDADTNWGANIGTLSVAEVGNQAGVSFSFDGLYTGRTTIVTVDDKAYVFSATFLSSDDSIYSDYMKMLKDRVVFDE